MSIELHIESAGRGSPLVLIHGWGLHGGIWSELLPSLSQRWRVICPDLPGHGASPRASTLNLDTLVEAVASNAPRRATYIGWSLGGMVAMEIARRLPQRVERLVLMATTPKFVTAPGWPCGVTPEVLDSFGAGLAADYRSTVRNFLTLQARGDSHAVELLRTLRRRVFAHGEPDPAALGQCLEVLASSDLRPGLEQIPHPTLVLAGEHDRLCPAEAGRRMASTLPDAEFSVIDGGSHAPFLSHRDAVLSQLHAFFARNHNAGKLGKPVGSAGGRRDDGRGGGRMQA
ncbi:MAG: pimeloyl-ACP methyl ester esterase BioH [Gammaproteobacteria bacterium]